MSGESRAGVGLAGRVLTVLRDAPAPAAVAAAVEVLRANGLVALPTETVYGLAGRALDARALGRIFDAKGRPRSHPLIAHVLGLEDARPLVTEFTEVGIRLAKAFWPGPLTLVLGRSSAVPSEIAAGGDSIAIRAPSHPVARAVIAALGEPVAAPSANRYQQLSPTTAAHVLKSLGSHVDLILDAGPCDAGIESTVVDVRTTAARILRPGAISNAALRALVPDIEAPLGSVAEADARPSPGMDAKHYAPRARLVIARDRSELQALLLQHADASASVALLFCGEAPLPPSPALGPAHVRSLPRDPVGYAHGLFAALHELDDQGVKLIVVESLPEGEAWAAVADRLARASS